MECSCPWAGGMSIRASLNSAGEVQAVGLRLPGVWQGLHQGPESHPDGSNFDHWKTGQLGFRTDWELNTRDTLTLQGDMYQGLDGERVAISLFTPPSREVFNGLMTSAEAISWDAGGGNSARIPTLRYRDTSVSPQPLPPQLSFLNRLEEFAEIL